MDNLILAFSKAGMDSRFTHFQDSNDDLPREQTKTPTPKGSRSEGTPIEIPMDDNMDIDKSDRVSNHPTGDLKQIHLPKQKFLLQLEEEFESMEENILPIQEEFRKM